MRFGSAQNVQSGGMTRLVRRLAQSIDFRWQLFWDIGFISVAVLAIVGAILSWVAYDEYRQARESEYRLLEAHARNADAQVAGAWDRIEHLLNDVAFERRQAHQGGNFSATLDRLRGNFPIVGTLLVADASGRIGSATDPALIGLDISREPYFVAQRDAGRVRKLYMSRPDKRLLGVTAAVFAVPILGGDGKFLGIAGLTIGFEFFPRVLQFINPDDSASMTVIFNRDGDLLFRRADTESYFGRNVIKESTVLKEHFGAGLQTTRHVGPSAIDGRPRMFVVREVGATGLGVILSRQLDEVVAKWRRDAVAYALIFVFTTVVVAALGIIAARRKREVVAGKAFAEQLIATANVMVVGLDAAGRISIFNKTAERVFGYRQDEVLGQCWLDLALPSTSIGGVREMFDVFCSGGELPLTAEYPILTKAGQERIISWQNSVIEKPRAAISFGIDVTERKQMEADLAAAKLRAEDANRAKSKFLAAVSHDLRQPIHAQGLFLGTLARTELSAHQREVLASASAASMSSVNMLNTLLDFSRIEAGVVQPRVQSFRLQPLLNKIEREFESLADAKGIAYRSRETDLVVRSDPLLVELILRNLVSNAIRYTERGGLLVACRKHGRKAVLEVWDTGIGIAPADQQAVFREFLQLDNPEQDRQRGLGLGLAIVAGLARTLGHRVSLVSRPQHGSVFRVSLPVVTDVSPVEERGPRQIAMQTLRARVLVLDDDENVCAGMLHLLRNWGCECDTAGTIETALELARAHAPDLIVSDYHLRERQTGMEAIAAVRAALGTCLPALLVTGDTDPDRLSEAEAGGITLLHKPVSTGQLYRGLATLLRR